MQDQFSRTQLLFGKPAIDTLIGSRVAVFGLGGVGGYVVEILARSGVGALDIFDNDQVSITNLNRQIIATTSTLGQDKVDVAEARILDINPKCKVRKHKVFYLVNNADEFDLSVYDYVVDCIDTVSAKMELVRRCKRLNVPIICSMGAANKSDPTAFKVIDISKTKYDPLAKIMRKRLRREGIRHFKCVCSEELPTKPFEEDGADNSVPASNAFVPAAEGIIVGGEVIKDLINAAGTMRIAPQDWASNPHAITAATKAQETLKNSYIKNT